MERNKRAENQITFDEDVAELLLSLTEPLRHRVEARYLSRRRPFEKAKTPSLDESTIDERLMAEFDEVWKDTEKRCLLLPGKETLAVLNTYLQNKYSVTIEFITI